MAQTIITAQSKPGATTLTDLYAVAAGKNFVCTAFNVLNDSVGADTFRVSLAPLGAADAASQYKFKNESINANTARPMRPGWVMKPTDTIRVYSNGGNCVFHLEGIEEDV